MGFIIIAGLYIVELVSKVFPIGMIKTRKDR